MIGYTYDDAGTPGGSATGGSALVEILPGTAGTGTLDFGSVQILADGLANSYGGNSDGYPQVQGNGGDGFGGSAVLRQYAGSLLIPQITLSAEGGGMASYSNPGSDTRFTSGSGTGGTARFEMRGGTAAPRIAPHLRQRLWRSGRQQCAGGRRGIQWRPWPGRHGGAAAARRYAGPERPRYRNVHHRGARHRRRRHERGGRGLHRERRQGRQCRGRHGGLHRRGRDHARRAAFPVPRCDRDWRPGRDHVQRRHQHHIRQWRRRDRRHERILRRGKRLRHRRSRSRRLRNGRQWRRSRRRDGRSRPFHRR